MIQTSAIQHATLTAGGFVLHNVIVWGSQYSAWYDAGGLLLDAERFLNDTTTRSVPTTHHRVRDELARIGRRYVKPPTTATLEGR